MSEKVNAIFSKKDMETFRAACELFARCDTDQAGAFVNEILMLHPMIAWNPITRLLADIESVSINGECIQLNIEEYEKDE